MPDGRPEYSAMKPIERAVHLGAPTRLVQNKKRRRMTHTTEGSYPRASAKLARAVQRSRFYLREKLSMRRRLL